MIPPLMNSPTILMMPNRLTWSWFHFENWKLFHLGIVDRKLCDQSPCSVVNPVVVLKNAQLLLQLRNLSLHLEFITSTAVSSDVTVVRVSLSVSFGPAEKIMQ